MLPRSDTDASKVPVIVRGCSSVYLWIIPDLLLLCWSLIGGFVGR
jgi:hypothetical protein